MPTYFVKASKEQPRFFVPGRRRKSTLHEVELENGTAPAIGIVSTLCGMQADLSKGVYHITDTKKIDLCKFCLEHTRNPMADA